MLKLCSLMNFYTCIHQGSYHPIKTWNISSTLILPQGISVSLPTNTAGQTR